MGQNGLFLRLPLQLTTRLSFSELRPRVPSVPMLGQILKVVLTRGTRRSACELLLAEREAPGVMYRGSDLTLEVLLLGGATMSFWGVCCSERTGEYAK